MILTFLISCQRSEECMKYRHEVYLKEEVDTMIMRAATESHSRLLDLFNESSIKGKNNNVYHMIYFSAHMYGKSIKIENKDSKYYLSLKCLPQKEWNPKCHNYKIEIEKEEWDKFEEMIYEFDFWTDKQFKARKGVLDGDSYFLEGIRPEAEKCGKRTHRLIGRGSPQFDKMGALCDYISAYEDILAFSYKIREIE